MWVTILNTIYRGLKGQSAESARAQISLSARGAVL